MSDNKTKVIFDAIVEEFKAELSAGGNPFKGVTAQMNGMSGNAYTGFNRWHMAQVAKRKGYQSPYWMTFKQAVAKGGSVRKGEKSTPVFFWSFLYQFGEITASGSSKEEALMRAQKKSPSLTMASFTKKIGFMKHFLVFNMEQIDNLDMADSLVSQSIEYIAGNCGALFAADSTLPYFDSETDTIHATSLKASVLPVLVEWTGGDARLSRSLPYEEEKLVQAIGAAFLAESVEDEVELDSTVVDMWLSRLDQNPNFLYKSASAAEKAFSLISGNVKSAVSL